MALPTTRAVDQKNTGQPKVDNVNMRLAMITLHHLEQSRSHRIAWLLEELALEYTLKTYAREGMLAPRALRAVHPLGKAPIISDGETVLAESGAIISYLVRTYGDGRLAPAIDGPDYVDYEYWLHYAEGSAMPPLLLKLIFGVLPSQMPWIVRPVAKTICKGVRKSFIDPQLRLHGGYIESALGGEGAWFAGDAFSAADIQMSYVLHALAARGGGEAAFPNISAFLSRIKERAGYQRAVAAVGEMATPT